MESIAARLQAVRERMAAAAARAGRDAASVRLVAVSKTKPIGEIRAAIAAGVEALGENYVQELVKKREAAGDGVEWHFIGHLQRNKAKYLAPFCALIHGIDSTRLAEEVSRRAEQVGRIQPCLIEVNLSGESTKFGLPPEQVGDLAKAMLEFPAIELRGLMTMPPYADDPEASRQYFVELRGIREELVASGIPEQSCRDLSMGMTQDFEVAIEEGATIVRVGTAIFGPRVTGP